MRTATILLLVTLGMALPALAENDKRQAERTCGHQANAHDLVGKERKKFIRDCVARTKAERKNEKDDGKDAKKHKRARHSDKDQDRARDRDRDQDQEDAAQSVSPQ